MSTSKRTPPIATKTTSDQKTIAFYEQELKRLEEDKVKREGTLKAINIGIRNLQALEQALLKSQDLVRALNKIDVALASSASKTKDDIQAKIKLLQDRKPQESKSITEESIVKISNQIQVTKVKLNTLRQEQATSQVAKRKPGELLSTAKRLKSSDSKKDTEISVDPNPGRKPTLGLYEADDKELYSDDDSDVEEEQNQNTKMRIPSFSPHVALFRGLTFARSDLKDKVTLKRIQFAESHMLSPAAKKIQEQPAASSSSSAAAATASLSAEEAIAQIQTRRKSIRSDDLATATQIYVNSFTKYQRLQRDAYEAKGHENLDPQVKLFSGVSNGESELVSTSLSAREAFRFASADNVASKEIASVRQHPHYDAKGKPHHRKLGVVIAAILSQEEYKKSDLTYVRQMYAQGKIDLKYSFVHGQEVIVGGGIANNKILLAQSIWVPDFTKAYKDKYTLRYGLTKKEFADYKSTFERFGNDSTRRQIFEYELLQRIIKFNGQKLEKRIDSVLKEKKIERIYPDLEEGQFSSVRKTFKMALDMRASKVALTSSSSSSSASSSSSSVSSSSSSAAAVVSRPDPMRHIRLLKTTQKIRALMLADNKAEAATLLKTEDTGVSADQMKLAFGSEPVYVIPRDLYTAFTGVLLREALNLSDYKAAMESVMPSIRLMTTSKSSNTLEAQKVQLKKIQEVSVKFAHLWCRDKIKSDIKAEFNNSTLDVMSVCMTSLRDYHDINRVLLLSEKSSSSILSQSILDIYLELAAFIRRIIQNTKNENLYLENKGIDINTVVEFILTNINLYFQNNEYAFGVVRRLISTLESTADFLSDSCDSDDKVNFNQVRQIRNFIIKSYEICLDAVTKRPQWVSDGKQVASLDNYKISSPSLLREAVVFQCKEMVLKAKSFMDAKPYFEKAHALKGIILDDTQAEPSSIETLIEIYKKVKELNPALSIDADISVLSAKLLPAKTAASASRLGR